MYSLINSCAAMTLERVNGGELAGSAIARVIGLCEELRVFVLRSIYVVSYSKYLLVMSLKWLAPRPMA